MYSDTQLTNIYNHSVIREIDRPTEFVLLVHFERVLRHCSKAFNRGKIWESDDWPDTSNVPTLGEITKVHGEMAENLQDIEDGIREAQETNLY